MLPQFIEQKAGRALALVGFHERKPTPNALLGPSNERQANPGPVSERLFVLVRRALDKGR